MPTIERILCPTDFSAHSAKALRYALRLAEGLHAEVALLHVCPSYLYVVPGGEYMPLADEAPSMLESARRELDTWVEKYSKGTSLKLSSLLEQGQAYKKIIAAVETANADLVVMGTHGRGGFSRLVMGSVTERVVRTSSRPVLTIPLAMAETARA